LIFQNNKSIPLPKRDNINLFGEIMESSTFSPNPSYYGSPGVHNDVHWIISNILGNYPAVKTNSKKFADCVDKIISVISVSILFERVQLECLEIQQLQ